MEFKWNATAWWVKEKYKKNYSSHKYCGQSGVYYAYTEYTEYGVWFCICFSKQIYMHTCIYIMHFYSNGPKKRWSAFFRVCSLHYTVTLLLLCPLLHSTMYPLLSHTQNIALSFIYSHATTKNVEKIYYKTYLLAQCVRAHHSQYAHYFWNVSIYFNSLLYLRA